MDNTLTRTDVAGRPVVERRHISFSALDKFNKCPRKFWWYDVSKQIAEPEHPAMKEGHIVHAAMADYIAKGKPLPPHYERFADWVTTMREGPADAEHVEHKLACTFQLKPCAYFSRTDKVWLRAQADYLRLMGPEALSVDWKTGQEPDSKYDTLPSNFQLRITALLIFLHYPQVQNIKSKYVYLQGGTSTSFDMPRADLKEFIPQLYEQAAGIQRAVRDNYFPPHPSGLCKRHCAVVSCEYHGKGRQ